MSRSQDRAQQARDAGQQVRKLREKKQAYLRREGGRSGWRETLEEEMRDYLTQLGLEQGRQQQLLEEIQQGADPVGELEGFVATLRTFEARQELELLAQELKG